MEVRTTRFSGAEWADQLRSIVLVGCGGIGSWTALALSRIGHELTLIDPDMVDETNVTGGQMFMKNHIGLNKVDATTSTCRMFGCESGIDVIDDVFAPELIESCHIVVCGLDNMKARRLVFESWVKECKTLPSSAKREAVLIDGRLTMEMWEVFTIPFSDKALLDRYEKDHLFSDDEAQVLDCTTKQSTGAAMGIAAAITFSLCNHLTNMKLDDDFRSVEFYQRMHYPIQQYTTVIAENQEVCQETKAETVSPAEMEQ